MKNYFIKTGMALCILVSITAKAQITETFDNLTLSPNSYYQSSAGADWQTSASSPMTFSYGSSAGNWTSGFAYTNMKDTIDGTASNLYGCVTYTAYDGGNYVTVKDSAVLKLYNDATFLNRVSGFFITNTTYVLNTLKNGNASCRKFGDTTGTFSGDTVLQGEYPDWLKVVGYGYRNGSLITDSVEFYLADYRPIGTQYDYIRKDWGYFNCTHIDFADSIRFIMRSSDNGLNGMNTPGYFSIDHITTMNAINVYELETISGISTYPNPVDKTLFINYKAKTETELHLTVFDVLGKDVANQKQQAFNGDNKIELETANLQSGVYFIELSNGSSSKKIKFIKQ